MGLFLDINIVLKGIAMTKDQIFEQIEAMDRMLKFAFDHYGEITPTPPIWPGDDETTQSTANKRHTLHLIRQFLREIAIAVDQLEEPTV